MRAEKDRTIRWNIREKRLVTDGVQRTIEGTDSRKENYNSVETVVSAQVVVRNQ